MPFNDLKHFPDVSHLREPKRGGLNYVHWKNNILPINGASSAPRLSQVCGSLSGRFQSQGIHLSRPVSLHGLCPTYVSREPERYRSLSSSSEEQVVSYGNSLFRFPQQPGACQQSPRLADICRSCPRSHPDRQKNVCGRRFRTGAGKHGLCSGCHHYRPVSFHVSMGQIPQKQRSCQAAYFARSAWKHSNLYPYLRRQTARCQYLGHPAAGSRGFLCYGSRIFGLYPAIHDLAKQRLFRYPCQVQSQISSNLFASDRPEHRPDLRPINHAHRVLPTQGIPRK